MGGSFWPLRFLFFEWLPVADDRHTVKWKLSYDDVRMGARFLSRLPVFLRQRVTLEEARQELRRRLESRQADFLYLLRRTIFENSASPYLLLLRWAGCSYRDIERLVFRDGIESALKRLLDHGVYLTIEEFKGRRPIIRKNLEVRVSPRDFYNPLVDAHLMAQSSGSTGARTPTPVSISLESIRDHAVNLRLFLEARGGSSWTHGVWGVPGSSAMRILLRFAAAGLVPERWFSHVHWADTELHPRYRWSASIMRWGSCLAGRPLPRVDHVSIENPLPILDWMLGVLRKGGIPHLFTFASSAVRLSHMAASRQIGLAGAQFWITGEPITQTRLSAIRRSGAEAVSHYGSSEAGGPIAYGCLRPERADHLHLLSDLHAVIQPGTVETGGLPPDALVLSSLRASAPFVLLNVAIGDRASVTETPCECPLAELGWTTRLTHLRSYEKLTTLGMMFLDMDVLHVLEAVLPQRFGGSPGDYQITEEEAENGRPILRLLVNPRVGAIDPGMLRHAFLEALSSGSGAERIMGTVWSAAEVLQVEFRAPRVTASGKIKHMDSVARKDD